MQTLSFPCSLSAIAIILNGQREAMTRLRSHWQDYQAIIVCDGAWETVEKGFPHSMREGTSPKVIVLGDGDSLTNKPSHFIQNDDQYSTDFEKALRYVLSCSLEELRGIYLPVVVGVGESPEEGLLPIDIYWANGGELDHTLGNMAMACKYRNELTCHFFTDTQYYRYIDSDITIQASKDKTLSLFPFPQCTVKYSTGILYPMIDYSMTQHNQQSLRNQISEELAVIEFTVEQDDRETGCFLFIEL